MIKSSSCYQDCVVSNFVGVESLSSAVVKLCDFSYRATIHIGQRFPPELAELAVADDCRVDAGRLEGVLERRLPRTCGVS